MADNDRSALLRRDPPYEQTNQEFTESIHRYYDWLLANCYPTCGRRAWNRRCSCEACYEPQSGPSQAAGDADYESSSEEADLDPLGVMVTNPEAPRAERGDGPPPPRIEVLFDELLNVGNRTDMLPPQFNGRSVAPDWCKLDRERLRRLVPGYNGGMPSLPPLGQTVDEARVMPLLDGRSPVITQEHLQHKDPWDMDIRLLLEALNYDRKGSNRQPILQLPNVPNGKVVTYITKTLVWRGKETDGIVVVGGIPARSYVLTRQQSDLLIENALIITRQLWEVFDPDSGNADHNIPPWLKRFAWPITKRINYHWLGDAAFHQGRLLGEKFLQWHESCFTLSDLFRRSGGFPTHKELRETINATSRPRAPGSIVSRDIKLFVDHMAVPPATGGWGPPPLQFSDYPHSRVPAVKMHPSGNPELTEFIQFVALNPTEMEHILQFLKEREALLEQRCGFVWERCDTEPTDWMLSRILPRHYVIQDFERGLGEDLKKVKPSPTQKGKHSTILVKEEMENGWVHRFLYVAPTEKAMKDRLAALGFQNPDEQFTTWGETMEGTKVIHVQYNARSLEEVTRMLDAFVHHEKDIKPPGAVKKAHERWLLPSRTWWDDGKKHDWVQVSIRAPSHGTSQEQMGEQPKALQWGPSICWDSLGTAGVSFSSQEGTNADGVMSGKYSFGQLPEAVFLFRTDAHHRLITEARSAREVDTRKDFLSDHGQLQVAVPPHRGRIGSPS